MILFLSIAKKGCEERQDRDAGNPPQAMIYEKWFDRQPVVGFWVCSLMGIGVERRGLEITGLLAILHRRLRTFVIGSAASLCYSG